MAIQSVNQPGSGLPLPGSVTSQGSTPPTTKTEQAAPAATVTPQQSAETKQAAEKNLEQAVKRIETAVQAKANNLQFSVDETTGQTVVRVVDATSGNTIRQMPSEEALSMAQDIERMQGLLVKDSA